MASLYKRNSKWYVAYFNEGRRCYRSTGTTSKTEAIRFLVDLQKTQRPEKHVTSTIFLQDFLQFSLHNHAAKTFEANQRVGKRFIEFIGGKYLHSIKPLDVERYKSERCNCISPVSVNIELRTIQAMLGYAVKWGLIERNPCAQVSEIRVAEKPPAYLTHEQFAKLLSVIERADFRDLVQFALHTGMRRNEILNLKWSNIDTDNRVISVANTETFSTKNRQNHHLPMNEVVYRIISSKEPRSEFVFADPEGQPFKPGFISHKFKRYLRKAGLPEDIHFHSLRHSFGSLLAMAGVPIFDIQKLLNHQDIKTTQVYSHLSPEHLRASVEHLARSAAISDNG